MKLLNYTLKEILFDSYKTTIFRAVDDNSGISVVLKKKDIFNTSQDYTSLRKEYNLLQKIKSSHVLKVIEFVDTDTENLLVFEDIGGISLKQLMLEGKISLRIFYKLALDVTSGLSDIHNAGYIHRDISLANIIWSKKTETAKIIDLNLAVRNNSIPKFESLHENIVGTLNYISPEQTGRVNYTIDFRSDLYSLGIVFYEILSGKLPFISNSEIELIHSQIAVEAEPLEKINPKIPKKLSEVVAKLMAKSPDDRYQTAMGLLHDLKKCFEVHVNMIDSNFEIGENDFSGQIQFPQKLYDREYEKEKIKHFYKQINTYTKGIALINGEQGAGKTYFVERFGNYVNQNHGRFISGRFSIATKNIPFSGIREVLSDYIYRIFSEGKEIIDQKRSAIIEAVGKNGKVLTDILPELEELIGKQPEITPLEGILAENRFNYILKQFFQALIETQHTSVVFLDNLQHIDSASLKLLNSLINSTDINGILIILAYRNSEINQESNLFYFIKEQEKNEQTLILNLQAIKIEAFNNYLADTFNIVTIDNKFLSFSDAIYTKTLGNPYFTQELLSNLGDNKYILFDFNMNKWLWDIDKIQSLSVTKNVADLSLIKIKELDSEIKNLLIKAACIGEEFELFLIYEISDLKNEKIDQLIENAIELRLIREYEADKYKFLHPDIYRSFEKLNEEHTKKELDLKIGNYFIQNNPEQIFRILDHYNNCKELFHSDGDKLVLAILNQEAGKESVKLIAYEIALEYFEAAISILQDKYWESDYNMMLDIYDESAEVAYLCSDYDKSDRYVKQVLKYTESIHDKVNVYLSQIKALIAKSKYDEALELGMNVLQSLGVNRFKLPNAVILIKELLLSLRILYFGDLTKLIKYEKKADRNTGAILQIIKYCGTAAFHTGSELMAYFCFKSLNLISSKKVWFEDVHYTLISYGMLMAHAFGKVKTARRITLIIENYFFTEEYDHLINKTAIVNYHLINHLHRPIASTIEPVFENFERCLARGDIEFAANSIMLHPYYIFWAGRPLSELESVLPFSASNLKSLNFLTFFHCMKILQQVVHNFSSENFDYLNIEGEHYSEIEMLSVHKNNHDITSLNTLYYLKLMQSVLFEHYNEAFEAGLEVEKYKKANYGTPTIPLIRMYFSISIALIYSTLSKKKKRRARVYVKSAIKQLRILSKTAPQNYLHKYYLILALYYEYINIRRNKAFDNYSRAIKASKKSKIYNEIALVYEFSGKYFIKQENMEIGEIYLFKAWKQYKDWGGNAKANQLHQKYGRYIKLFSDKNDSETNQRSSEGISQEGLDIESIIKASQMISEEIKIKELQDKLIRVLLQNAGAQKGVLIGIREDELYVLTVNNGVTSTDVKHDYSNNEIYPQALANYVLRNAIQVVFDNLSDEKKFNSDQYVIINKPKSVVCSPIMFKQKVQGIIYLENNLLEGAFNPAHVSIINLLSSQIAISLENAQLYENLEEKVKQRTEELNIANKSLQLQNRKVEELYQSVTDSILSAYRIQQAMLPPKEILESNLKDFFILFKPRNVVSGDFYWYKKQNDNLYIAAADCTGHGVPGAFMSILGILLLDDIVVAFPSIKSSEILEKLRSNIKISLKQNFSSESLKEGMDIAFCIINTKTNVLQYSGAYNPLYLYRNNELTEIKATRNPVGIHLKELPFVNHEIKLEPNDKIYLFSDGFLDQMGGANGYKFMAQKFRKLMLENHHKPMLEQAKIYEEVFDKWKGDDYDQTDDVLLLGFEYI